MSSEGHRVSLMEDQGQGFRDTEMGTRKRRGAPLALAVELALALLNRDTFGPELLLQSCNCFVMLRAAHSAH